MANHVDSLLNTRRRQDDVELGEGHGVMNRNRLCVGIEVLDQVEATHFVSVDVDNHTSRVLHANVHHLILVDVGQLEGLANVGGGVGGNGNGIRLTSGPSRIVIGSKVPALRSL